MEYVETSTVELKEKVSNFQDIAKTTCGFANAEGGKIIIGVSNKGIIVGVSSKEIEVLQQRLEGAIQTVNFPPFHKIEVKEENGKKIIIVEIYKIGEGSFCTYGGIVYYRFGSILKKIEGKMLQDFLIHRKILSFDETASEATLDELEENKLKKYLEERNFKIQSFKKEELLINLGVVKKNEKFIVKNTAVLLFAKNPSKFIPQNEIKLVRFKGTAPINILDSKYIQGTILENIEESKSFIDKNTRTSFEIKEIKRKETPEYPKEVIREALINAIVHRDYFSKDSIQINIFDNRLEIINPGSLPQGLSMKLLGTLSIQRNPALYRLLRDIKLVEGLATGIPRMRESMIENKLPEPVFEDLGSFFKVTLYNSNQKETFFNLRQQKAITYIQKNKRINSPTYAKINVVSRITAVSDLNDLVRKGILQKIGKTRNAYYVPKQKD